MSPRVSVLLTSYNRPAMLAEAVESVLAQTYPHWELLVLDDNSSDPDVPQVLARYWNQPGVRIIKSDVAPADRRATARYATMINLGLQIATGEYITYLCDDDLYKPRRLELMAAKLAEGHDVVYGSQEMLTQAGDGWQQTGIRPAGAPLTRASCIVDHSSVMHTAAAGQIVGGWDDSPANWRMADAMFWDRLTGAGYVFHPVPEVTDVHRFHAGSVNEAGAPA